MGGRGSVAPLGFDCTGRGFILPVQTVSQHSGAIKGAGTGRNDRPEADKNGFKKWHIEFGSVLSQRLWRLWRLVGAKGRRTRHQQTLSGQNNALGGV